jgi:hypothetical protein
MRQRRLQSSLCDRRDRWVSANAPRRAGRARSTRALLTLAVALTGPLAAHAQAVKPLIGPLIGPPAEREIGSPDAAYPLTQPGASQPWTPRGWGLFATAGGRSMDLARRSGWAVDPNARPGETEAGLGWRGRNALAVMGYATPDPGAAINYPRIQPPQGVVGLNLALRTP